MAHNTRIRPDLPNGANPWVMGQPVTQAECQAFDDAQFKSVNGDAGGVWTPAAQIVLGGLGLKSMSFTTLTNCTAFTVPFGKIFGWATGTVVALVGTLTFQSGSTWRVFDQFNVNASGTVNVDGGCTVNVAATTLWTLNGNIGGTCAYQATTNMTGTTNVSLASGSALGINAGNTFLANQNAALNFTGATTYSSTCTLSQAGQETPTGSAATTQWRFGSAPDADTSFDCSFDLYKSSSAITANRTYTLLDATATIPPVNNATLMRFVSPATGAGHSLTFIREDGSTIAKVPVMTLRGANITFIYRDGAWHTHTWHE